MIKYKGWHNKTVYEMIPTKKILAEQVNYRKATLILSDLVGVFQKAGQFVGECRLTV
jgi:hypothetical protein